MSVIRLARVRADRLRERIGQLYELLVEAEDNDNDRRAAELDAEIREAVLEWDEARLKDANAAQNGRGGER